MPTGIYIRTEETKKKMSDRIKANPIKGTFKKGHLVSPEIRLKISIAKKGKYTGENSWRFGKKASEETKRKIGEKSRGRIGWNKGLIGVMPSGENHPKWKGDKVSYRSLHSWVGRKLGKPSQCDICNLQIENKTGKQYHWANISRRYLRELSDWIRLCAKCHKAFDHSENQVVLL